MKLKIGFAYLLFGATLLWGCSGRTPLSPKLESARGVEVGSLAPRARVADGAQHLEGEIGPGARYGIDIPAEWNGDLVLFAHGFLQPTADVTLPTGEILPEMRDGWLARGFAVAYSSYSENGWAVKDGVQRTQQLLGIFAGKVAEPRRTFLVGQSLGGLVALQLAEEHPDLFVGALPLCGVVGGTKLELDYLAHIRVLFDYFYPDALPGSLLEMPESIDLYGDIIGPAGAAMAAHPEGAGAIVVIMQYLGMPIPIRDVNDIGPSIIQALVLHALELNDFLERTHGHSFFDNSATVYGGPLPPELLADLNARVERYQVAPDAKAYIESYYQPTGKLVIPILTVHNRYDPVVPAFHEPAYHDIVARAGRLDLLLQREIDADTYGHPVLDTAAALRAFDDLVRWVETREKPAFVKRSVKAAFPG